MARFEELAKQAAGLGIDVAAFEALKAFGEIVAVKALETAVKTKQTALDQIDHVETFMKESGPEVQRLFDSLALVRLVIDSYNVKHSARLVLDVDAESAEAMIIERKRGPRSVVTRDIPAFAAKLKASPVFTMKLRLKESRDGEYHHATLMADGKVKNGGGETHDSINSWASYVYDLAVQANKRDSATCNVWVSVEIARKQDAAWVKLGEAYEEVMAG